MSGISLETNSWRKKKKRLSLCPKMLNNSFLVAIINVSIYMCVLYQCLSAYCFGFTDHSSTAAKMPDIPICDEESGVNVRVRSAECKWANVNCKHVISMSVLFSQPVSTQKSVTAGYFQRTKTKAAPVIINLHPDKANYCIMQQVEDRIQRIKP